MAIEILRSKRGQTITQNDSEGAGSGIGGRRSAGSRDTSDGIISRYPNKEP